MERAAEADRGASAYRAALAHVHDVGFGFHGDNTAPGVLALLAPLRGDGGLVLELGCGSGALTRHLVEAGHEVLATDASPAMLQLAAAAVPGARYEHLVLPDDPLPSGVAAVVSVGHVLSYLADRAAVERALRAAAAALRPGGVLAVDLCDLAYGAARTAQAPYVRVEGDWAIATRYESPARDRFVRRITVFVRDAGDPASWRRDDEVHDTVLVDVAALVGVLDDAGLDAEVRTSFGDEELPSGLLVLTGRRRATGPRTGGDR